MKISQAGLNLLKGSEGLRLTAYKCPAGVWTIGWGHTGDDVYEGLKITRAKAEALFREDTAWAGAAVAKLCKVTTQNQFDAMASLCFNIGEAAFRGSSVARLHNTGRHAEAAQAFALFNKRRDPATKKLVISKGLVARRAEEAALYCKPDADEPTLAVIPQAVEGEKKSSRVINGSALGGVGLAGAALKDSGLDWSVLGEIKATVLEFMPYLGDVNWGLVIAGVGMCGVAYAIWARWQDRREGRA